MFKCHLDGLHHQEQVRDYVRELKGSRRGIGLGLLVTILVMSGALALVYGLGKLPEIAAVLTMVK